MKIKELLDRYYEGETTDAEEQRLREYFTSDEVDDELQHYRSIFAYLKHEGERHSVFTRHSALDAEPPKNSPQIIRRLRVKPAMTRVKWWYAAAAAVACLLTTTYIIHEHQSKPQTLCVGTYVVVNGICYDDLSLVKKYAAETIDMVTQPFGDGSITKALDFLE